MTSIFARGALTALALASLATPALAQTPSPPTDGMHHRGAGAERMHEMMQKHHEAMAHDLHTILNIRPDQEAAFSAFETSMMRPPRDGMKGDRMKEHAAMMSMTTPQKLDMRLAHMTERMDHMRKHIEATKTFYAALSPEQQHVFDALQRLHGGHHGGGGHWGGRGRMMHGPMEGSPPPAGE